MYKKLKANDPKPKKSRPAVYRFETTPEWNGMRADIDKGLKPFEMPFIQFTPEDQKKYNIKSRRTIQRFLQAYIESKGLPYVVKSFERDGGTFEIGVTYEPVVKQRA